MLTVVETPLFLRYAAEVWDEEERETFVGWIASHPDVGDVIPGTGGLRKIRWSQPMFYCNGRTPFMDKETEKFVADVVESIRQAKRGEVGRIHTPEQILARRGRPPGSVASNTKQPVKLRLDPDLLAALRASGAGWQTRVNAILREAVLH